MFHYYGPDFLIKRVSSQQCHVLSCGPLYRLFERVCDWLLSSGSHFGSNCGGGKVLTHLGSRHKLLKDWQLVKVLQISVDLSHLGKALLHFTRLIRPHLKGRANAKWSLEPKTTYLRTFWLPWCDYPVTRYLAPMTDDLWDSFSSSLLMESFAISSSGFNDSSSLAYDRACFELIFNILNWS